MDKEQRKLQLSKFKKRIISLAQDKSMFSVMNDTKWKELQNSMRNELPFPPPYDIKDMDVDGKDTTSFSKDVCFKGNWDDEVLHPFFRIEWIKIRPRYIKHKGNLIDGELIDETEEFLSVLKKYSIPYEEDNGAFIIYGYKRA